MATCHASASSKQRRIPLQPGRSVVVPGPPVTLTTYRRGLLAGYSVWKSLGEIDLHTRLILGACEMRTRKGKSIEKRKQQRTSFLWENLVAGGRDKE
jgi:hypothetical protein